MIKIINKMKDKDITKPTFKPGHIYMSRNDDYSPDNYYFCGEHETEGIFMVNLSNGFMIVASHFFGRQLEDITDKVSFYIPLVAQKDPTYDCISDTSFSPMMDMEKFFIHNTTYMDGYDVFLVVKKSNGEKYRAYISGRTIANLEINGKDIRDLFTIYKCNLEMVIRDEEDV